MRRGNPIPVILLACILAHAAPYPLREYMAPFWESDTMYHESVLMVSDSGKAPEASLLFDPVNILSVRSAGLDTVFKQGVDWIWEGGTLKLIAGTKAASITKAELYPVTSTPGADFPKNGGGYIRFAEGHFFHDRQLSVTYTHARNVWAGPIPALATANLPKTLVRLSGGQPVRIVLLGNSITAGYNASGFTGAAPSMPAYGELAAENLRAHYGSPITVKNVAVAGKDAAWGLANVHTLVTLEKPDLAVISFGMNDGSANVPADTFLERIKGILADVSAGNPNCEFILVAPMLANPESGFSGAQATYKAKLQTLVGAGVSLVDMTGTHQELLKRKAYRDMTGNNINHPNDFLHRWYAQQLSWRMIPPSTTLPISDTALAAGLSPLNWARKPGFAATSVCGASVKAGFRDTRRVVLNVDTRNIKTTVAARYPILAWSVNGGALKSQQLVAGQRALVLDAGTADPVIDLYCKGFSPFEDRYHGDAPVNSLVITGFTVDAGGRAEKAPMPQKVWLNIGNSIESGDGAAYASGQGRPPDDLWAASDDGRASYGYLLASHFGYRESRLAYGGYNWGGSGPIPRLSTLIDSITSTTGRLTGNVLSPAPEIVLINLGENGVPAGGDVTSSLVKIRSRIGPAPKLLVMIPVSGKGRNEITAAFNAYKVQGKDDNAFLIDAGIFAFATCDGQHPTAAGHKSIFDKALPLVAKYIPTTGMRPAARAVANARPAFIGSLPAPALRIGDEAYYPTGRKAE